MIGDIKQISRRETNHRRNDLAIERRERRLSIKQAALIIGVSDRTLAGYERGRYMPSLIVALKLQILYRGQIASFYQPLYGQLSEEIRAAELRQIDGGGAQ